MHLEARNFLDYCNQYFKRFYKGKVLDVGSGDINGTNKIYFPDVTSYTGCDIFPGNNVDIVSKCHELPFSDEEFDIIISSECFEHDMYWEKSIVKIMSMLKTGGLFIFTCASTGRGEHGTRKCHTFASLTTRINDDEWADYYRNLTENDILSIVGFAQNFKYHRFYYNPNSKDLYFVGMKGPLVIEYIPDYNSDYKIPTLNYTQKTVVVYVYHQFNTNVDIFVKYGLFESNTVDFIIVCNGENVCHLPNYKNVSQMKRQNIGHDFGGWSDAIFQNKLREKYNYFLLINSTVRGPFLPPWCPIKDWTQLFTRLLDYETKLSGTTLGFVNGAAVIQSMVLCLDIIGLDIAIKENIFIPNPQPKSKINVVMENEVGLSVAIRKNGYRLRSILAAYYNTDLRQKVTTDAPIIQHCMTNGYFGTNIHPYEVIFIKDNCDINHNLDIDATTKHLLNNFDCSSKKEIKSFVVTPSTPMVDITPSIIELSLSSTEIIELSPPEIKQTEDTFDWKRYLQINPDLAKHISNKERAFYHWTHYGSREGRKYK